MCPPVIAALPAIATAIGAVGTATAGIITASKAGKGQTATPPPQAPSPIDRVEQTATTLAQPKKQAQQPSFRTLGSLNQNFNSAPINTAANIGSDYNNIGLNIGG